MFNICHIMYRQSQFLVSCDWYCSGGIEKIAWDASGERLAVSYKDGNELYKGLIAVYDVKRATLITPSLMSVIFTE